MTDDTNRESGDGQTTGAKVAEGAGTEAAKTFTQDELNRILAKEQSKWKREHSDAFAKATEFEKLQQELKQKQEAELSELEKLTRERDTLTPFKERSIALEGTLKTYLDAEIERIPEELRELIPSELSVEKQLEYIAKNRARLMNQPNIQRGPSVNNPLLGKPDLLLEQATKEAEDVCRGKPQAFKDSFIARRVETLRAQKFGLSGEPDKDR